MRIAVIGAGLAGISFANALTERATVSVFEKSRGIGGRMATRYAGIYEFDHGAQYFTAREPAFRDALTPHIAAGRVAQWEGNIVKILPNGDAEPIAETTPIYVASPRMNSLVKAMADGVDVALQCQVTSVQKDGEDWVLTDTDGHTYGPFDWVVSAAPAPQTAALAPQTFEQMDVLQRVRMTGCFTLILGSADGPEIDWNGAKVADGPIGWIAVNSDKPGRETSPSLVVQTTNEWAEAHLEEDPDAVRRTIIDALLKITGIDAEACEHSALHRWRYANTPEPAGSPFLIDPDLRFAACGDWCLGGRVEAAFMSGTALADAVTA